MLRNAVLKLDRFKTLILGQPFRERNNLIPLSCSVANAFNVMNLDRSQFIIKNILCAVAGGDYFY